MVLSRQRRLRRAPIAALLFLALVCAGRAGADVPAANQAMLVLRILSYDRNVADRAGKEVTIAVLARAGSAASETMQGSIAGALQEAGSRTAVSGLPVKVVKLNWAGAAKLESDLAASHASALYVGPELADAIGQLPRIAQKHRILSFSEGDEYVNSGVSIALVRRENRVAIVVNLPGARSEGADLDSALLRIAEVVR
jgi:aconitase A